MEILHLMVPIAVILVIIAIALFFWAVRTGQFDDLERQGFNILLDEEQKKPMKHAEKSEDEDEAASRNRNKSSQVIESAGDSSTQKCEKNRE